MTDKIRVGIVGATVTQGGSGWGANAHVPALHALPNYKLKAVCTAHKDTAKVSAEKFGADLAFHDMGEMVGHPDVDLVTVVVRVPWHKDLVMQAIDANDSRAGIYHFAPEARYLGPYLHSTGTFDCEYVRRLRVASCLCCFDVFPFIYLFSS